MHNLLATMQKALRCSWKVNLHLMFNIFTSLIMPSLGIGFWKGSPREIEGVQYMREGYGDSVIEFTQRPQASSTLQR